MQNAAPGAPVTPKTTVITADASNGDPVALAPVAAQATFAASR